MTTGLTRRQAALLLAASSLAGCGRPSPNDAPSVSDWPGILDQARGQTMHWYAWGGDARINAYIAWVAEQVAERHDIRLVHVKAADTAGLLNQLVADKTSGRSRDGRTDLVWINGENFAAARRAGLLFGPFADALPNWTLVDTVGKPATVRDFMLDTEGFEAPWGLAQLTFFHDAARLPAPPRTLTELLAWTRANPGRFTYPAPPDFVGSTFLKQALHDLMADAALLARPLEQASFDAVTAPLWRYLDALHPWAWRRGRSYPQDAPTFMRLMEDQEIDLAFGFNPAEAASAVIAGRLPASARAYTLRGGTIQNSHFVAIPFNAPSRAAALVTADFLLSPGAQARKADPSVWGDATVLAVDRLEPHARAAFTGNRRHHPSLPSAEDLARNLAEPHGSWQRPLEDGWRRRYGA
ncbi:ABC transporter substrate-binding protein [Brevundimonas sp.]|uniref:ABC transporter substrate-binding protein n=1 Tax=Brevundimonas sp. TaxID=1871086 RepID=UPI003F707A4D